MEVKTARELLLDAIDTMHPATAIDNLRLMERIDQLLVAHLQEWKRMGCMRDSHISCERCAQTVTTEPS